MATFLTDIEAIVSVRDAAFIARVASDLNLNLEELKLKYADVTACAFKIPKKRIPREPKNGAQCKGTTAKGEPCKFSANCGSDFCKRHSKEPKVKESKPEKPPKEAKPGKMVPEHSHELDGEVHDDCCLCKTHEFVFHLPSGEGEGVVEEPEAVEESEDDGFDDEFDDE
jgi:hypothetical protein